jgi:hypothetical protein
MSVAEVLVTMGVTAGIGSAALALVNVARIVAVTQPEVADVQQRLRVGIETIASEVAAAGAGLDRTSMAGPLGHVLPPVAPYRRGQVRDDARSGVWFRPDVVSTLSVASAHAQAAVSAAVDLGGILRVSLAPNCGAAVPDSVCGFAIGSRALILHESGAHDFVTVERVSGATLDVSYVGTLAAPYDDGRAALARADAATFGLQRDAVTGVPQISRYDGFLSTFPAVDHVVGLSFEYFGAADPPVMRDAAWLPRWQAVSYGPVPPAVGAKDPSTSWGAGENCTFAVSSGAHAARLAALGAPGTLVPLTAAQLRDGPWCPDATSPRRFDADLLRVRRVRIRVRVEAALSALRGWGALVARPGTSAPGMSTTADHQAVVDVAPRNTVSWH